ncbi:RagB/SusD family nutrient uptake outer membrane protein [Empedobacter falsenii]|uniref:SusD family n=1 Tax=Empedobacter falsenii TaxID=343874 RepID=A0A376FXB2_9FLAO|nr:RagB/SusD family nutrient uptake outer membrane protein [Empedobacter falsenii]STD52965.1 SusD family [Empedobacter falsenii]
MKKNIFVLSLFTITLGFTSCSEDDLNQFPDYGIGMPNGGNPITDETTMAKVLTGMYQQMSTADAFASTIPVVGSLASDDFFVSTNNSGYYLTTSNLSWTPSSSDFTVAYNELYDVVAQANIVLNATIEETTAVKKYKAQAYTARGMAHLYLAMGWAENPTSGKNQEYGIAIYTGNFDPNLKSPRSTVEETYNSIIEDLKKGIDSSNDTPASKAYLSATSARLLLAKAYLWKGDYANAISMANEAINSAPASFSLLKNSQVVNYFYGATGASESEFENQPETVWEVGLTALNNPGVNTSMGVLFDYLDPTNKTGAEAGLNARRSILARQSLYDLYNDGDIRKTLFVKDTRTFDTPSGYFINKYRKTVGGVNNIGNIKILRLTEAKFIKWEAMAKSGQGATALTELNEFALERGGSAYSGDALTAILAEKRKEFAGEGQRFYDLKRNNLSMDKVSNVPSGAISTVAAGDKLFVFPIPSYSINVNTNMTQYPGWVN